MDADKSSTSGTPEGAVSQQKITSIGNFENIEQFTKVRLLKN